MLKLKPSMRTNRRHILVAGNRKLAEKAILEYVGVWGWAKAEPVFNPSKKQGKFIISVNRKELDKILGAFAVSGSKLGVIKISGTLKGLGER